MNFTIEKLNEARGAGIPDEVIWKTAIKADQRFAQAKEKNIPLEIAFGSYQKAQPTQPAEPERPAGTSFSQEVAQLGPAFTESLGRPLENMGEGFEVVGFQGVANALKGAVTEPENYVSAAQRFMEPEPGESQFLGFAWQYAPRAAVEQTGQAFAAIGGRAAGALVGGAVAGPPGAIAGGLLGPAIIGAAQVIGPVAKERARNNGREIPNNQDLAGATLTALGSGALDAIGARYLPGGDKATGKFFKRVASSFVGEGLLTEAPQSGLEQVGGTLGTEAGLKINAKQMLGEGFIAGTSAAGLTGITYPFTKDPEKQTIRTPEQAKEIDIDGKSTEEAVELMGQPGDDKNTELRTTVKEIEREIANNETLINGLEPNDPERTRLELQNAEAKKIASRVKGELEQTVGLTSVETEQARLAREIAAPPAAPTAESPTVTPAPVSETITEPVPAQPAAPAIEERAVETETVGELGVLKPTRGEPIKMASKVRVEERAQPVPDNERYSFEETLNESQTFFDGTIPEGFAIVNDTTDPELEFKAAYYPSTGQIALNRAYIKKGDKIEDLITHELGHYIYSDPEFQTDFKGFWESIPENSRAEIDGLVNQIYNKDTNQTQIEEKQVIAFASLVKRTKEGRTAWMKIKDFIKKWVNRILKKNIKLSDEGAMAVLSAGFKRFKSGEQIIRAIDTGVLKVSAEPRKPAAEEAAPEGEEEGERAQVASMRYGKKKTTPIGINKKTETIVQKQVFSGDVAPSPEKTTEAYDIIEKLLDPKEGGKYAEEVNEITRAQMSVDEKRQVDETIGAVKLGNELFKYAVNLATKGDLRMLQLLFERANDLAITATGTISKSGRDLQARANLASWVRRAAEAQKKGVVNSIAIQIYGPGVTKEQMDSIIEALNQMNKVKTAEAEQVYDDLETTGEREGVDIRGAVERAIRKADPATRDPWVMALEILKAIEGFQTFTYQRVKGATKKTIQNLVAGTPFAKNLANFQKKMIDTGASGLNTIFWKTLSDQQQRMGRLAEVDMAVNRNLAGIVRDTLVRLGLKGEPGKGQEEEYKKMTVFEQVANILAANESVAAPREGEFVTKAVPLSQAKMLEADRMIIEEINRREAKAIEDAGDNAELQQIAEAEANALRQAWDEAMSRQLDIPISDATLRRLIFAQLKQSESSLRELTDAIVNDNVTGTARKEGLLTSVIQQLDGLTKEGDTKRDYTKLREALSAQLDQMVESTILKKRMNSAIRKVAKESNPDKQAERQIERLADLQSDVQAWPKTREDKVRDIVREDLQQKLDLGLKVRDKIKAAWKGVLRQKLIDAGVKESTAERLTDIVWRQHEINYLNRKMKDVEMAVTRGPIAPIVNAIKNTPLSQQQDPKWKRKVAYEYLVNAGLDKDTAGRVADLMDLTLQKVFVRAQEKAFNDIVGRKLDTPNSRRQMQRFLQAIRAGALDPTKNLTSEIAAQNGWTGFTAEQVAKLNELDTIVNDPKALDLQRSTAFNEIQNILKTSKLDPTVIDTLSAYYTAQALSGIPTTTVNIFSAIGFSMRNAMTDVMKLAATNPSALPAVFDTFISSWKTYGSEVLYAFKNNVQRRGTVEYLSNDDALLRLYNKGKRQWNEGKRAEGFKNMLFGMMEYVGRWLKALDEGAVSVLEQQGLTRYAMAAMKQAGISSKDANAAANYVQSQKQQFIVNAVAKGMNKTEAKALSDDVFRGAWIEALSNLKINSQEVLDSALNDSLSAIGRMNNTFDQLRQETRDIKDNGFVSSLPIGLLERLGEAMNSPSATEGQRIFYRMVYGFAVVPARVMREAAWYSPYGFVRFAIDAFAKGRGKGSPYAQSLGTDLQFRQRLTETIAGSIVLGALMALSQGSVDDPEDESPFKIVVTGNGPERRLDPQFHDAFFKKYSRNSLHVFIGKTKFKINIERGFEAFAIPFMLAGAIDDWRIRKRFEQSKKTPSDLSDASILLGSAFLSFSRRGPFAAYMDGIISSRNSDEALTSLGSFLTFTGKTFVPIAGTSLARNISDFVSDPVERRSMEGALWANTPVIGPMMGTKSMNAIGETTGAGELSDRFYKLGMPIVFNLPGTPEQTKLRDLIIEKGQGPDIPTRYDARRALGFEPTDQQFERYITAYGQYMKERMLENYTSLEGKTPVKYVERLQVYQKTARLRAKQAVTKNISQP